MVKSLAICNSGPELVLRTFRERMAGLQRLLIVRVLGMRKMGEVLSRRRFPREEHEELRRTFVERWADLLYNWPHDALPALHPHFSLQDNHAVMCELNAS